MSSGSPPRLLSKDLGSAPTSPFCVTVVDRALTMVIREIQVSPDPVALARALRGAPGLSVLRSNAPNSLRLDDARFSFVACAPVEVSRALVPEPSGVLDPCGWGGFVSAPRWIGVIPYEALRSIERPRW